MGTFSESQVAHTTLADTKNVPVNSEHFKGKISKGIMSKGNISKYAFHMFRELVYLSSNWPYVPPGNTFDMN